MSLSINLVGIAVDDQEKALAFYTETLGFEKHTDVSNEGFRWVTVTAPAGHADVELVLEPSGSAASQAYREALRADGIPVTAFYSDDIDADYERLVGLGVTFTRELTEMPWGKYAILDDTCGNLVQIQQLAAG